jgi:hypothetical protein
LCLPLLLALRNGEKKQQALIVKVTFCGNGNLRKKTRHFGTKKKNGRENRRGNPSSRAMPIIANENNLSSIDILSRKRAPLKKPSLTKAKNIGKQDVTSFFR